MSQVDVLLKALEDAARRLEIASEDMRARNDSGWHAFDGWAIEARAAITMAKTSYYLPKETN